MRTSNTEEKNMSREQAYSIVRFYAPHIDKENETILEGLTLEEAKAHCSSSATATDEYFDGFTKE